MESSSNIVCPSDKSGMMEGVLFGAITVSLAPEVKQLLGVKYMPKRRAVKAYYCPKCGKIELYASVEKGENKNG